MKTVILGMNNPHREGDPLSPDKTAGKNLWLLSRMERDEYDAAFERMNMLDARDWSKREAAIQAMAMRWKLSGRRVIVLGREIWQVLRLPEVDWFASVSEETTGSTFTLMPHPSGKNLIYNCEANRRRARRCMESEARKG